MAVRVPAKKYSSSRKRANEMSAQRRDVKKSHKRLSLCEIESSSKRLRLDERASAQKRDAKKIAQTELFARNKAIITPAERAERSPRLYRRGTSVTCLYAVCKVDVGAVASETDILPLS